MQLTKERNTILDFKPISEPYAPLLRKYYSQCTYRLCEYSLGVKLMWREHWRPEFAESHGCLVVLNHSAHYGAMFDFPFPCRGRGTWTAPWMTLMPGAWKTACPPPSAWCRRASGSGS